MTLLTLIYSNDSSLESFVQSNPILQSKNVLVQIFSGIVDEQLNTHVAGKIKQLIPQSKIIGTTTAGEICHGLMYDHKLVISFSIFEATTVRSNCYPNTNTAQLAQTIIDELVHEDTKALIVFSDGLKSNGEDLLLQINRIRPDIIVAGGRAGDNHAFSKTLIFTDKSYSEEGVVAASLSGERLHIHNHYILNWDTIGEPMRITHSENNRLFTINDQPALEIYAKYLGKDIADALPESGIEFPLILQRGSVSVARAPVAAFEDGSLLFGGNINEGEQVKFGFGNLDMVREKSFQDYDYFKTLPIEAAYIYSCSARKALLGKGLEDEFEFLENLAPTVGFFTYGEYFHSKQINELLNITSTFLALSETDTPPNKPKEIEFKKISDTNRALKALSHLVSVTSKELQESNEILHKYKESLEQQVEEEIKKRQVQEEMLLQQSRLAAMGEMVGNIAHQWRQPLNTLSLVIGNLEDIYESGELNDAAMQRTTEKAYGLIEKMSATIDDFRNFFSPDKNKQFFSPKNVIEETIGLLEAAFKHNHIDIRLHNLDNVQIQGYKNELSQVVLNIINNAKDALLSNKIENPIIDISEEIKEGWVYIYIKDNAGGIPSEITNRIFDPYFTTKEQGKGTGIGLYMSKTIIEEHMKGILTVHNDDQGAIFTIKLKASIPNE